jgi:hypothetical protein
MARKVFDYGTTVRAKVTFRDIDTKAVIDPSALSVVIRNPDATTTTYVYGTDEELVKSSTGVYYVLIALSATGTFKWRWLATVSDKAVSKFSECDSEKKAGF